MCDRRGCWKLATRYLEVVHTDVSCGRQVTVIAHVCTSHDLASQTPLPQVPESYVVAGSRPLIRR